MQDYKVLGLMSGTSLDGLDIAYCQFNYSDSWKFEIIQAETISYNDYWVMQLSKAHTLTGEKLTKLSIEFAQFMASEVIKFQDKYSVFPDFISSHGHTVFHQPENKLTLQIGSGAELAALTNTKVICDFRSMDIALGGNGAPLVPIGDHLLFSNYDFCLNIGGFSNISYADKSGIRRAFDICPANLILNHISSTVGHKFDDKGILGRGGEVYVELLNELNSLDYYNEEGPKSLGREWLEREVYSIFKKFSLSPHDRLRTVYEHIAIQISKYLKPNTKTLITGGGAHNSFLIERIKALSNSSIIVPDTKIVDFKEALIFAFLGVLRERRETNCIASVTGAARDSSSGIEFEP